MDVLVQKFIDSLLVDMVLTGANLAAILRVCRGYKDVVRAYTAVDEAKQQKLITEAQWLRFSKWIASWREPREICGSCRHYWRCRSLIYTLRASDDCDFSPSRFSRLP